MKRANSHRGEVDIVLAGENFVLRPSFSALVEIENEIGSILGLVERAAGGTLTLNDITTVIWACLAAAGAELEKNEVGQRIVETGVANVTKPLRDVLTAALSGRAQSGEN